MQPASYHQRFKTLHQRFFEKIDKNGEPQLHCPELGKCWKWKATKSAFGYGLFHLNKRKRTSVAHRVSWMIHKGEVPDGMFICHKCDNPECCNPDHLFIGTQLDNLRDCISKRRKDLSNGWMRIYPNNRSRGKKHSEIMKRVAARGEKSGMHLHPELAQGEANGNAKLTQKQVDEIRQKFSTGNYWKYELANEFGVNRSTIGRIISREIWTNT